MREVIHNFNRDGFDSLAQIRRGPGRPSSAARSPAPRRTGRPRKAVPIAHRGREAPIRPNTRAYKPSWVFTCCHGTVARLRLGILSAAAAKRARPRPSTTCGSQRESGPPPRTMAGDTRNPRRAAQARPPGQRTGDPPGPQRTEDSPGTAAGLRYDMAEVPARGGSVIQAGSRYMHTPGCHREPAWPRTAQQIRNPLRNLRDRAASFRRRRVTPTH